LEGPSITGENAKFTVRKGKHVKPMKHKHKVLIAEKIKELQHKVGASRDFELIDVTDESMGIKNEKTEKIWKKTTWRTTFLACVGSDDFNIGMLEFYRGGNHSRLTTVFKIPLHIDNTSPLVKATELRARIGAPKQYSWVEVADIAAAVQAATDASTRVAELRSLISSSKKETRCRVAISELVKTSLNTEESCVWLSYLESSVSTIFMTCVASTRGSKKKNIRNSLRE
jgi:hypothetical protein